MNMRASGVVLDSSAILRSSLDYTSGGFYVTGGVLSEVLDPGAKDAIDYGIRSCRIKILEPAGKYVKEVLDAAKGTGDDAVLSEVDVGVIAAALEHGFTVASDDYAIQNVCSALGLGFQRTVHDGIKRQVNWIHKCTGCGRTHEAGVRECWVCGSEVRRKRA